jgi:hypothetical protein
MKGVSTTLLVYGRVSNVKPFETPAAEKATVKIVPVCGYAETSSLLSRDESDSPAAP